MHKRPLPKIVMAVDRSALTYAPVENSIVYKLTHQIPYPQFKPKPYVPLALVEDIVSYMKHRGGVTDEEIEQLRLKNHYVPAPPPPPPKKKLKKKKLVEDIDTMFSQYTKPAVKKKILKAVVKKI